LQQHSAGTTFTSSSKQNLDGLPRWSNPKKNQNQRDPLIQTKNQKKIQSNQKPKKSPSLQRETKNQKKVQILTEESVFNPDPRQTNQSNP
jgi:hypothetical protein